MKLKIYHKFFRGCRLRGSVFLINYSIGNSSGESEEILILHKYHEYFLNSKVEIEISKSEDISVQEIITDYLKEKLGEE